MTEMWLARPDDADEVGRIWAEAFAADPVLTWVFAEPDQLRKLTVFFTFLAREVFVELGTLTVTDGGAAAWTPPDPAPWPDERVRAFGEVLAETTTDQDRERLSVFDESCRSRRPGEPHWYLSIVGVDLAHRSQGLGSRLLAESLRTVDAAGLPAYLESTNPRNLTLYERAGFEAIDQVPLPDGPSYTCMWREARPPVG